VLGIVEESHEKILGCNVEIEADADDEAD